MRAGLAPPREADSAAALVIGFVVAFVVTTAVLLLLLGLGVDVSWAGLPMLLIGMGWLRSRILSALEWADIVIATGGDASG